MAYEEKFLKAIDTLGLPVKEPIKKRERMAQMRFLADYFSHQSVKSSKKLVQHIALATQALLQLCDDQDVDIRMLAEEILNRVVRNLQCSNLGKVQVELLKAIKTNGTARSLRAALWRISQLAHHIRPHEGKFFVAHLLPALVAISERSEEQIHDTLAQSVPNIFNFLCPFMTDADVKMLLKAFLKNVVHSSAAIRRYATICVQSLCIHCKWPQQYANDVTKSLLDMIIPVNENHSEAKTIGVLNTLKLLIPLFGENTEDFMNSDSKDREQMSLQSAENFITIYELCLHYMPHNDHNIVNAVLDTLNVLLEMGSNHMPRWRTIVLCDGGLPKSRRRLFRVSSYSHHSPSVAVGGGALSPCPTSHLTVINDDDNAISEMTDITTDSIKTTDIATWINRSHLSVADDTSSLLSAPEVYSAGLHRQMQSMSLTHLDDVSSYSRDATSCYAGSDYNSSLVLLPDLQNSQRFSDNQSVNQAMQQHLSRSVLDDVARTSYNSSSTSLDDKIQMDFLEIDIGSVLDSEPPILYCTRFITRQFLLTGYAGQMVSDKCVRVSVKSTALACLAAIIDLDPNMFFIPLDRCRQNGSTQRIFDVMMYTKHGDPQIRGLIRLIVGVFVRKVQFVSNGHYTQWISSCPEASAILDSDYITRCFYEGLKDDSTTCCRLTLNSLKKCLSLMCQTRFSQELNDIFDTLLTLSHNPYWLVKVDLCNLVSELNYADFYAVSTWRSYHLQNRLIQNVLFRLLYDEDIRVRQAAAMAIVRVIPNVHDNIEQDQYGWLMEHLKNEDKKAQPYNKSMLLIDDDSEDWREFVNQLPFPLNQIQLQSCNRPYVDSTQITLSKIINNLFHEMIATNSTSFKCGCMQTLSLLSEEYPATVYSNEWGCSSSKGSFDILVYALDMLQNSKLVYDIVYHTFAMNLMKNIYAGHAYMSLQTSSSKDDEKSHDTSTSLNLRSDQEPISKAWRHFNDKELRCLSHQWLQHCMRMLNIFHCVVMGVSPWHHHYSTSASASHTKTFGITNSPGSSFTGGSASISSPLKRRKSDLEKKPFSSPTNDRYDEKQKNGSMHSIVSTFSHSTHYRRIYDTIKSSYSNYKTTIDVDSSENLLGLLNTILQSMTVILELAGLDEIRDISKEMLLYLKSVFYLQSETTVACVRQLLRCLFSANLGGNIAQMENLRVELYSKNTSKVLEDTIYGIVYGQRFSCMWDLVQKLRNTDVPNAFTQEKSGNMIDYRHRRQHHHHTHNRKHIFHISPCMTSDMEKLLQQFVPMLEPIVIKSLRLYTNTGNVRFQSRVLDLLLELMALNIKYCLGDADQIFYRFVVKQLNYIEDSQLRDAPILLPRIFRFLVVLSAYSKVQSKTFNTLPEILQLCDGLMASGISPSSHCIPALRPIVYDVFMHCYDSTNGKEANRLGIHNDPDSTIVLNTTREFVFAMLLRLIEHPAVFPLITIVLKECKFCTEEPSKWFTWSRAVHDAIGVALKNDRIQWQQWQCIEWWYEMWVAMHPDVRMQPVNWMFSDFILRDGDAVVVQRKIANILVCFLVLMTLGEDQLMTKIEHWKHEFGAHLIFDVPATTILDPLNVIHMPNMYENVRPELILVKFLLKCIHTIVKILASDVDRSAVHTFPFILVELRALLTSLSFILQRDDYKKFRHFIANNCTQLDLQPLCDDVLSVRFLYPMVVVQWFNILSLLNYDDDTMWQRVLSLRFNHSLNSKLISACSIVSLSDYLAECTTNKCIQLLTNNHLCVVVDLFYEPPVAAFVMSLHQNFQNSELYLNMVEANLDHLKTPLSCIKLMKSIEFVHRNLIGRLIQILVPKLIIRQPLPVGKRALSLATYNLERLLTFDEKEVRDQISSQMFTKLMDDCQAAGLSKTHQSLLSLIDKVSVHACNMKLMECEQSRCVPTAKLKRLQYDLHWYMGQIKGRESALLLEQLSSDDVANVLQDEVFDWSILVNCINLSAKKLLISGSSKPPILLGASLDFIERQITKSEIFEVTSNNPKHLFSLATVIGTYIEHCTAFGGSKMFSQQIVEFVTKFIKYLHTQQRQLSGHATRVDLMENAIKCIEYVASIKHVRKTFVDHCASVDSDWVDFNIIVNYLFDVIEHLLVERNACVPHLITDCYLSQMINASLRDTHAKLYSLVTWLLSSPSKKKRTICNWLMRPLERAIIALARLPMVHSYMLVPHRVWKSGCWQPTLGGPLHNQVPPLPVELLQDVDVLHEFIDRVTLLGWTQRQQFEETWMCLLSVLHIYQQRNADMSASTSNLDSLLDEMEVIQLSSLAINSITVLLDQVFTPMAGHGRFTRLEHITRNSPLSGLNKDVAAVSSATASTLYLHKLQQLHWKFEVEHNDAGHAVKSVYTWPNFERDPTSSKANCYYGGLSVAYLIRATMSMEEAGHNSVADEERKHRALIIDECGGVDVTSCIHFLLELYTQILYPHGFEENHSKSLLASFGSSSISVGSNSHSSSMDVPIRLMHAIIKSVIVLSDMFTSRTHFEWLLRTCQNLIASHEIDDHLMHELLIIGLCKAIAVLHADLEMFDFAKRIIRHHLACNFLSLRIATLYGVLYLIEGCVINNMHMGGLSEEIHLILPNVMTYVLRSLTEDKDCEFSYSAQHTRLVWSIALYIIENVDEMYLEINFIDDVMDALFVALSSQSKTPTTIMNMLMKGLERLLIVRSDLRPKISKQALGVAFEKLRSDDPIVCIMAEQLLFTFMYTEHENSVEMDNSDDSQLGDSDHLVHAIERTSALFDHIRNGHANEVKVLCHILPTILDDFFSPADILTKVIGEFLSQQQPYPKLLSMVVFKVFQRAIQQRQLQLLQDWVVFGLPNFSQSLSIGMSTWYLTCFFISASQNDWLRAYFPHVQRRVGRYDYEDRVMLCVAGRDFYSNLTQTKQKETFLENFRRAQADHELFGDLLDTIL